jgi:hypothetical protein
LGRTLSPFGGVASIATLRLQHSLAMSNIKNVEFLKRYKVRLHWV